MLAERERPGHSYICYYGVHDFRGMLPFGLKGRFYTKLAFYPKGKTLRQSLLCVLNGKILCDSYWAIYGIKPMQCKCYAPYNYVCFAQYTHGMACMRKGYLICVYGLLTCPICVWESHMHMGAHTAYRQPICIWGKADFYNFLFLKKYCWPGSYPGVDYSIKCSWLSSRIGKRYWWHATKLIDSDTDSISMQWQSQPGISTECLVTTRNVPSGFQMIQKTLSWLAIG